MCVKKHKLVKFIQKIITQFRNFLNTFCALDDTRLRTTVTILKRCTDTAVMFLPHTHYFSVELQ